MSEGKSSRNAVRLIKQKVAKQKDEITDIRTGKREKRAKGGRKSKEEQGAKNKWRYEKTNSSESD